MAGYHQRDKTARIRAADGTPRATLTGHRDSAGAVAIAPDGSWLATTCGDLTARIWEANGTLRVTLCDRTWVQLIFLQGDLVCGPVAIAPDGSWLLTSSGFQQAGGASKARIWAADGTPGAILTGHKSRVEGVAIAPDGTWLATTSAGMARIWGPNGTLRATLTGHKRAVHAVAIAPNGTWLATTSADKMARIWAADGTPRATLTGHKKAVGSVAIAPDGTWLATTSADGTARIWTATTSE